MKNKSIITGIILVFLIGIIGLLLFNSTQTTESDNNLYKVKIAYLPIASDLPFFVAMDKGYFIEEGLQVEAVKFETSNDAINAVIAGQVDASATVGMEAILAVESRSPGSLKIVNLAITNENGTIHRLIALKNSNLSKVKDLDGKKVGVMPGGNIAAFMKILMKKENVTFELVQLKPSLQLGALQKGEIDALLAIEPTGSIAESRLNVTTIVMNPLVKYSISPLITSGDIVPVNSVNENRIFIEKYRRAVQKANNDIASNKSVVIASLEKWLNVKPEVANKVGIYHYTTSTRQYIRDLKQLGMVSIEYKLIERELDYEKLLFFE